MNYLKAKVKLLLDKPITVKYALLIGIGGIVVGGVIFHKSPTFIVVR